MPSPIISSSSPRKLTPNPASDPSSKRPAGSRSLRKVAPLAEAGGSLYRLLRFIAFYAALLVLVMYGLHTFTELEIQYDTLPLWFRVGSLGVLVAGVGVALVVWFRRNRA